MKISSFLILLPSLLLLGCATGATDAQLKSRVGFELGCETVDIVKIDERTRGVRGCGQQAVYVEQCAPCGNGYPACECTWQLDSNSSAPVAGAVPDGGDLDAPPADPVAEDPPADAPEPEATE